MSDVFNPYADAQFVREPHGQILIDDKTVADTLQCVHCNAHWAVIRGSGTVRGFCRRCMGPVCGRKCAVCVPFEQRLEQMEQRA